VSATRVFAIAAVCALFASSARAADDDEMPAPPTGSIPPPAPAAEGMARLRWDHPRFSTLDWIVTASGGAITLGAAIVQPMPRHAVGGVLFDESVRDALRLGDSNARYIARDISDVGVSLVVTWPIFVDSLTTAWWYRGSREAAQEMALIDLETLAITGAVQGVTNVLVSRERPYVRDCGTAIPANTLDCDGTTRYRSFFSGHSAFSFASAALVCVHHFENDLLGAPYDAISCVAGYAVAATTATMRVVSDVHYSTDALTGALVGTLIGYGVPWLHYRRAASPTVGSVKLQIVPTLGGAGVMGVF
jgi:membrane-associated phospholipid phosphatase